MGVDLHFHSNFSDGVFTPMELIHMAHENNAQLVALTDHDTTAGLSEARQAAENNNIKFINGAEISVSWQSKVLHIVALNFNHDDVALQKLLASIRSVRIKRLEKIAAKLQTLGIEGLYEGALALAQHPDVVGRLHMAKYLLAQNKVSTLQQAFRKYLGEGRPGYVKVAWGDLTEVVETVKAAGGMTVLAHPLRYNLTLSKLRKFLEEFVVTGGKGIEVGCSSHQPNEIEMAAQLAQQFNLLASVGSDFHGNEYDRRKIGVTPNLPDGCQPIWEYF